MKTEPKKAFDSLDVALWSIRDPKIWGEDAYFFKASPEARKTIGESLGSLLEMGRTFGKGVRRFRCNPNQLLLSEGSGTAAELERYYGKSFVWWEELKVQLSMEVTDETIALTVQGGVVHVSLGPKGLAHFIEEIQRAPRTHGSGIRGSGGKEPVLLFTAEGDWIGAD